MKEQAPVEVAGQADALAQLAQVVQSIPGQALNADTVGWLVARVFYAPA
ncbi:hypothetical protein [Streptomyces parvulus]